ncbi:MAG TPA: PBP1A family penicillin-binding protein [Polyangia bacterium]|nr:PBP1A family penicillin-binding protein [Polyangia bacterium]
MAAGPSLDDRDPRRAGGKRGTNGKSKPKLRAAGGGGARPGPPWKRALRIGGMVATLGLFAAIAVIVGLFSYYGSDPKLPDLSRLDTYRPKQVTRILDRNGKAIGELGSEKRTVIPYEAIPKVLVNAVVSAEDADYFHHSGLNYRGMIRAFLEDVLRGRRAQGGSSITQQVVKNLVLSPERTMRRKVQEIILARQLTEKLSKEEVLALYLNQIYYGHGRYGCEEAARYFFGKSVRDINVAEAALLAGLPQSPERLSPRRHPEAAKTRQRYVLGQMAEHGYIDRATADRLAAEPIRLARESASARGVAAEAVDVVGAVLAEKLGESAATESGTTVTTTLDGHLQELARASLERGLEDLDARQGFRGPSGHLTGKPLDLRRYELVKAHAGGLSDSEIVEGIVTRVEPDPKNVKLGRLYVDAGVREKGHEAMRPPPVQGPTLAPARRPGQPRPKSASVPVVRVHWPSDEALAAAKEGVREGVADLALEPRYGKGTKALAERFKPGDLVRVRYAPDRPHAEGHPLPLALELGPQAAMVVLDPATHQILALVGGYDYHSGGFDRSLRANRQPGSAFKPIVYATAIEAKKITPATIINDAPEVYDLWKPQNYEKEEFRGPVRVRTALAESINTVAIRVLSDVGIDQVRAVAARVGITSPIAPDVGLSLALGSLTVTPLELANAYAAFADGGQAAKVDRASLVSAIGDQKVAPPQLSPGLPPEVAYVMVSLMRSVIDEGTARSAVAGKLHRPVAGKTGTSNGQRDAWFVGFTPDLLAAVWVGFDDMKKLGRGEAGGKTAAPIWADFMAKATAGKPTKDFAQPPGVVVQRIDKATGLLAAPGQESGTLDEVFLDGTAPTQQAPSAGEQSADKLLLQ